MVDTNHTSSSPTSQTKWETVLAILRGQMSSATYEARFVGTTATLDGEILTVHVKSNSLEWVENRLRARVEAAVRAVYGPVAVVVEPIEQPPVPVYLPVDDLPPVDDIPEEKGFDAEFLDVFYDKRNALIQPGKVEQHTQYFRRKWRPLLGPLLSELVRELRQRCYHKDRRTTLKTTYKSLARALGVSERTIKRALKRKDGQFKNKYLGYFIKSADVIKFRGDGGKIRNEGTRFVIYLDEPLTPKDEVKLAELTEGTKWHLG